MWYFLRFTFIVVFLCIISSFRYPNAYEEPGGIAIYHFNYIRDTTNLSELWQEDFQLVFDGKKSSYISYTKKIQDSLQHAKIDAAMRSGSDNIDMGIVHPYTSEKIYVSQAENFLCIAKPFNDNNYLIREELEKIDWKIFKETKKVLGFHCQKATGICKGRSYTAWFTIDIPAGFGPWKLQGLPGLIMEAYDVSQRIRFVCTNVQFTGSGSAHLPLDLPKDAIATSPAAFARMEKAYKEGVSGNSMNGGEAIIEHVKVNNDQSPLNFKTRVVNFPLELNR
ncbi:GLPGLI family protein [Chitinophaga costaii]|uniref:GLPGLI family protein n=1 Tax=Chitinophaga costaii TaxID=1335309 RepID=A0A1C4DJ95_9BACT|nr:GLPGLI family protein [Chitinophaga costaii]PUZ24658.1 GLPGLI family protein [Chitinophaga costaii]SCC31360.1 GLPGLI family protein [Chitinophaga costaii]